MASAKQKILLVDDDDMNLEILYEMLQDDYELKTAVNGEQALDILIDFNPKMILLDVMMPGMDGYEVCKLIREDNSLKNVKVILVSGKAMEEEKIKGLQAGAEDYLSKPFTEEQLMQKVNYWIKKN